MRRTQPKPDAPAADAGLPAEPVAESDAGQEFDLSSLPKLEELTATTDITAFLRKGVPEHLRNAALRKSWALDPAIRNYVNPALDYAYDWNTPGGVPGSGEIGAGVDVARLVSQIMGSGEAGGEPPAAAADIGEEPASDPAQPQVNSAMQEAEPDLPPQALRLSDETIAETRKPSNTEEVAGTEAERAVKSGHNNSAAPQQVVRRHGSAKPLV